MPIEPLIIFRAGRCDIDTSVSPPKVTPKPEPGYLYLYPSDDELIHLCWRKRDTPEQQPEIDLVMIPGDGNFLHYDAEQPTAKTNGRIYVLKFNSSSQRYLFWLQSAPENPNDFSNLSDRDRKITDIVYSLLQGEEVDISAELAGLEEDDEDEEYDEEDDEDEDMEDAQEPKSASGTTGGAGADATGGDVRDEGEDAREGGADGGRANAPAPDANTIVRNLLASLEGSNQLSGAESSQRSSSGDIAYPSLPHLLPSSTTVPLAEQSASEEQLDTLISFLPPSIILCTVMDSSEIPSDPTADMIESAKASLTTEDKRTLVSKVLRSPQFSQSLGSLTMAIRDGGLPTIADALKIDVENGGYMKGSAMPLGGGRAVEAFVNGIKKTVTKKE